MSSSSLLNAAAPGSKPPADGGEKPHNRPPDHEIEQERKTPPRKRKPGAGS